MAMRVWEKAPLTVTTPAADLGHDRLEGFLGRVGVNVMPCGASFAVSLDTPPQEIEARLDVRDHRLAFRQAQANRRRDRRDRFREDAAFITGGVAAVNGGAFTD
jgi:hypothetical protein